MVEGAKEMTDECSEKSRGCKVGEATDGCAAPDRRPSRGGHVEMRRSLKVLLHLVPKCVHGACACVPV